MKKILFILFLFQFSGAQAQWINSLSVSPANPTTNDLVYVFAECDFTAGSCDQHTQGHSINGSNISAWALHCVGMLTFICPYTDTFSLGMLAAGTYIFTFQLDQGGLPSPCSPGIVPGPSSTFTFTVSTTTAVSEQHSSDGIFSFFPNPVDDKISVRSRANQNALVRIFNVSGKKILEQNIAGGEADIYTGDLTPGIYFLESGNYHFKFIKR